ncbi:MAG: hypothetical protein IM571_01765 [Chitinophagaceae bacterium]|jgi:hypothetical protein|nr:hypothetical protein [Chitinophagaceae bacterium]MCA6468955.1 hypothetical protein [Chitinophagaceae bacterium]MCA6476654.1 hypothetical protein [Chitinophagaceae bacterium]MCA6479045.1 hypothetical protein [Chitinophagaceae bacterium]MCA6491775.1 hypothetical protein [Chitinophagaceae bacterium]
MRYLLILTLLAATSRLMAQDTSVYINQQSFTLAEVVVRNNFNYRAVLSAIQQDTSFYKAFRNLRILGYSSYNDIRMLDKKDKLKASLNSKTRQHRINNCRYTEVLQEEVTGDFYAEGRKYNYMTAELYASLFFAKDTICGENNIVKGHSIRASGKKGLDKHKEQLKMLFFNPGKKIPGIPFIGDKLDLYDESAHELYDYRLDVQEWKGSLVYVFTITPKEELGFLKNDRVVVDRMVTWMDMKTLEVMARNYSLSYKAGVYDFDVSMEVEMTRFKELIVPRVLRYKGNWDVVFKKREKAVFTATLFDFK